MCLNYTGNLQKVGPRFCEDEIKKLRSLLPAAGKQNTTFSPYFTQPGVHLLEIPCRVCVDFVPFVHFALSRHVSCKYYAALATMETLTTITASLFITCRLTCVQSDRLREFGDLLHATLPSFTSDSHLLRKSDLSPLLPAPFRCGDRISQQPTPTHPHLHPPLQEWLSQWDLCHT